jgi:glutamyl-tRNA synthetase
MIRTRFAPSPTGDLHVGSVRTALFCWLYAKKHQGEFILRIEDTDTERSTPEAVQVILDGLAWMQLHSDHPPIYQSKRMDRYREVIEQMLAAGTAYYCHCSKERLASLRDQQTAEKHKPRYDGYCRELHHDPQEGQCVIRFKNPKKGAVRVDDKVLGAVVFQNSELDDFVIARADGSPTYNFCVVVDDMDMAITHVIRGSDHLNNTPRQVNVFQALGAKPPVYAHLPMILGDDGKKLSKRHGAVSVLQFQEEGYLPEALRNYIVRLGWSHGDQEIFTLEEMIKHFDIGHISKSPAAFNTPKLQWLNQHYFKTTPIENLATELAWHFKQLSIDISGGAALQSVVALQRERVATLREMAEKSRYFYEDPTDYDDKAVAKHFKLPVQEAFEWCLQQLDDLTEWKKDDIHQVISDASDLFEVKMGNIAQPIRIAMTGGTISPPIDATLEAIGKAAVIRRFKAAMALFAQ